ncbi:hypothetical protein NPIL_406151 [Nephila pilipes]|uniref:Uncharacterized protein n=1 Tax=Nephila pilipes TaxID=299642 RepID=A0A8X6NBH0_NEPPI|nr:hypothetical protein NPIL_406151 [Nephila pilipes]
MVFIRVNGYWQVLEWDINWQVLANDEMLSLQTISQGGCSRFKGVGQEIRIGVGASFDQNSLKGINKGDLEIKSMPFMSIETKDDDKYFINN